MGKEQERPLDVMPQETKGSFSGRRSLATVKSLKNAIVVKAMQPIVSLRSMRVTRESGSKLLAFAIKVAGLEIIRRHTQNGYPLVWNCIQSLPLLHIPPFSWLLHWGPLNYLLIGSQAFSKPIMFLSLANTISDKLDELRTGEQPASSGTQTCNDEASVADSEGTGPLAIVPTDVESFTLNLRFDNQREEVADEYDPDGITLLKRELKKSGVSLPERIGDDELKRFLLAANNNVKRAAALVKRNICWREKFYFFPQYDLEKWSSFVFWHGYDAQMRPSLVVRIGWAYSILKANECPRFTQAILSQVEYGITHLLQDEDPRITVIIDCEGTPAIGFPINMLNSCCARIQDNYPTIVAVLFVVNLPPVVRVIAQAIIQVLKPATKRRIFVQGDPSDALVEHYGSPDCTPIFLGGSCSCSYCDNVASTSNTGVRLQLMESEEADDEEGDDGNDDDEDDESDLDDMSEQGKLSTFRRCNSVIRSIIMGFLVLWVAVILLTGFLDPDLNFIPT